MMRITRKSIVSIMAPLVFLAGTLQAAEPLVDVEWAKSNQGNPDIVFLDVGGKTDYLRAHIPGAVHTDYGKDGWRFKDANGTPGMLAPTDKLEALIGGLGIGNESHVVIVPIGSKASDMGTGTRIFWTFKVLGHDNVSILNGGMAAYTKDMDKTTKKPLNPLEKGAVKVEAKTFKADLQTDMLVSKDDVLAATKAGGLIVDHRPHNQYIGINKHGAAKKAGTIPGALNVPENWLTENGGGSFREKSSLEKLYAAANVSTTEEQINFCNTGHWASLGWFASHEILGNKNAKMYDGSMLEWTSDASLPLEQKVVLE